MRSYRGFVLLLTVISVVTTGLSLLFAYMTRYLINSASDGDKNKLFIFSAVLLGLLLVRIALQTFSRYYAE